MAALLTFKTIQDQVMLLAGMSGTADRDLVKDAINIAYNDVWSRYGWAFKRKEGWAATKAPYSTGTVEATAADELTLTGGTWPTDVVGMVVGIPGLNSPWYRVLTRTSGTVIKLDRNIPSYATEVPAGTAYYAYSREVDISSYTDIEVLLLNHVSLHDSVGHGQPLLNVPETAVTDWGFPRGSGRPVAFSETMVDPSVGTRGFVVGPLAPDRVYQVHFFYEKTPTALSADGDTPELPANMRHILVHGALRIIYRQDEFRDTGLADKEEAKFEREIYSAWSKEKRSRPRVQYVRPFDNRRVVGGIHFVIDGTP